MLFSCRQSSCGVYLWLLYLAQVTLQAYAQNPAGLPTLGTPSAATPPVSSQTAGIAIGIDGAQNSGYAAGLTKPPFPLGGATAAYQVEGAWNVDGRGPSIWDTFSQQPGKIRNGDNGNVADDFYHRYSGDIASAQALGFKLFRFSISWSRILPTGSGQVNQKGIDFYNNVINSILDAGMQPHVTLYHWDMPQALQDSYGGWLDPTSITDFENYAKIVFTAFSDRVNHWTTFNEMRTFIEQGYKYGAFAPGRCSDRSLCQYGDASTEPYIVLRNVLLAHGRAVAQLHVLTPGALVSCNFNVDWEVPLNNNADDQQAVQRALDFTLGIYADPLFFGKFPDSVVAAGLPNLTFSADEFNLLRGSVNYFALNHYTTNYVTNSPGSPTNGNAAILTSRDGVPIGPTAQSSWLYVYPSGIRSVLQYVNGYYNKPIIFITECGVDVPGESDMPLQQALNDTFRISFFQGYVQNAIDAVQLDGVNVQGFIAWSLLDNFEWADGYSYRFGLIHVDYTNNLTRYVKESAKFLAAWFRGPAVSATATPPAGTVSSSSVTAG